VGTYSASGFPPCAPCPLGFGSFVTGATKCERLPCGEGEVGLNVSTLAQVQKNNCSTCPINSYAPSPNATSCLRCPTGTISQPGAAGPQYCYSTGGGGSRNAVAATRFWVLGTNAQGRLGVSGGGFNAFDMESAFFKWRNVLSVEISDDWSVAVVGAHTPPPPRHLRAKSVRF
jgi:hypothetical protein